MGFFSAKGGSDAHRLPGKSSYIWSFLYWNPLNLLTCSADLLNNHGNVNRMYTNSMVRWNAFLILSVLLPLKMVYFNHAIIHINDLIFSRIHLIVLPLEEQNMYLKHYNFTIRTCRMFLFGYQLVNMFSLYEYIVFQPKKYPTPISSTVIRLTYGHFYIEIRSIDTTIQHICQPSIDTYLIWV